MEFTFQNFQSEYQSYSEIEAHFLAKKSANIANIQFIEYMESVSNEFKNLDVKMRLAFGISDIKLNNNFVSDKEDDLKLCHLLYYKLADLWFAYETYLKLFEIVTGTGKLKIVWLDSAVHNSYSNSQTIISALNIVNLGFATIYNSVATRNELKKYLVYCASNASTSQKNRLNEIIDKIGENSFILSHSEILTIIYAIRNNFVHNGETTVVPAVFGYKNKSMLLQILYPYLSIVLLNAANITCRRV